MRNIDEIDIELEESDEELYEHYSITADKGQGLIRIDRFLTDKIFNVSRNRIQTAANEGMILVNGDPVKSNYKVKPLDKIAVMMPYPRQETELFPQDIPINIIYEDDELLIVNKEAGMVVHPGHGHFEGTLMNALMYHLKYLPLFQSGDQRPGLVHRIDKDTSGLLVIAKTDQAYTSLAKQFFDRTVTRRYHALVWGIVEEDEGTIRGNIGRSVRDRLQMAVFPEGSDEGKHAVTHYRVLERFAYTTLVECKLETGRTHQIRAHFTHIGHPLFNDDRYGGDKILKGTSFTKYRQFVQNCFNLMPRQGLHAVSLGFTHPKTGKFTEFESSYPSDFEACIDKWRNYIPAEND